MPDTERPTRGESDARGARGGRPARRSTDVVLIAVAIAMLVVWAVWTFVINDAPGGVHVLLTVGVFLLIWRIVAMGTPDPKD